MLFLFFNCAPIKLKNNHKKTQKMAYCFVPLKLKEVQWQNNVTLRLNCPQIKYFSLTFYGNMYNTLKIDFFLRISGN